MRGICEFASLDVKVCCLACVSLRSDVCPWKKCVHARVPERTGGGGGGGEDRVCERGIERRGWRGTGCEEVFS